MADGVVLTRQIVSVINSTGLSDLVSVSKLSNVLSFTQSVTEAFLLLWQNMTDFRNSRPNSAKLTFVSNFDNVAIGPIINNTNNIDLKHKDVIFLSYLYNNNYDRKRLLSTYRSMDMIRTIKTRRFLYGDHGEREIRRMVDINFSNNLFINFCFLHIRERIHTVRWIY